MIDESLIDNLDLILNSKSGIALMEKLFISLAVNGKMSLISKDFDTAQVHKLGDICEIYQPKTISTSELIQNGEFLVYGANGVIGNYNKFNHEDSEVLVTCRGATCGTVNVSKPYSWINGNAMVVRPKHESLRKDFLTLVLKSVEYEKITTGTAQPQITRVPLANVEVTVPSLAAQEKVVNIIGSIFELLSNLKLEISYRDLMKSAARKSVVDTFSTAQSSEELNDAWERIQNNWEVLTGTSDSVESIRLLVHDLATRGNLSGEEIFEVVVLKDIAQINYGYTESAKHTEVGPKFLRITDIQLGKVDWDTVPYCPISSADEEKHLLKDGDLVFARTGATTGKSFLLNNPPRSVCASYLIRVRPDVKKVLPEYLYLYFQSGQYWVDVKSGMSGTAQGGFNSSKLGALTIRIPDLATQAKIVKKTNELLQVCDDLGKALLRRQILIEKFARSVVSISA
jgi:restriction endonuclease S subunit